MPEDLGVSAWSVSRWRRRYGGAKLWAPSRRSADARARATRRSEYAGCPKQKRRFRPKTTDSRHLCPIAPNRLAQRPAPTRPDEIWLADITCVSTRQGWAYLAGALDLYSRRIVGWALAATMPTALAARALKRALTQRRPGPGLLHHSDRGSQYASDAYRRLLLTQHGVMASMSRRGNCYDNAVMESFWGTLKAELTDGRVCDDVAHLRAVLFDYLEIFYNRARLHGALGYQTPVDHEANLT